MTDQDVCERDASRPTIRSEHNATIKVKGGTAAYLIKEVAPGDAEGLGCPGATHMVWSDHGPMPETLGRAVVVTGRDVKVPSFGGAVGQLSVFTPWSPEGNDPEFTLKGWVISW